MPIPKVRMKLPVVLSREEVTRLIEAACSLMHRTTLLVLYATGIRRAKLARLKAGDIDGKPMVVHIQEGKGGRDGDFPMTPKLLEALREYSRSASWMLPDQAKPLLPNLPLFSILNAFNVC